MFIDTHCHLEDENFSADRQEVLNRAKVAGVERIINFGSTLKSSVAVVELAKNFSELYAGVGIHPEEIDDFDEKTCARLAELAAEKKVVAVGEIGLDYHWEKDSARRLIQQKIFIEQLDLARQLNLPVCVHDRGKKSARRFALLFGQFGDGARSF